MVHTFFLWIKNMKFIFKSSNSKCPKIKGWLEGVREPWLSASVFRWFCFPCPFLSLSDFPHLHNGLPGSVQMKAPTSKVTLQEGMELDCLCPWTGQLIMVSWTKKSLSQPVAVYHPQYGSNYEPSYDGRVTFLKSTAMDGSISIMNVTEGDIGQYHCSLQTYPRGSWTKDTFVEKAGELYYAMLHFLTLQPQQV